MWTRLTYDIDKMVEDSYLFSKCLVLCRTLHLGYSQVRTVSVVWREKGYTVKYSLSTREIPRAEPEGFPEGGKPGLWTSPSLADFICEQRMSCAIHLNLPDRPCCEVNGGDAGDAPLLILDHVLRCPFHLLTVEPDLETSVIMPDLYDNVHVWYSKTNPLYISMQDLPSTWEEGRGRRGDSHTSAPPGNNLLH